MSKDRITQLARQILSRDVTVTENLDPNDPNEVVAYRNIDEFPNNNTVGIMYRTRGTNNQGISDHKIFVHPFSGQVRADSPSGKIIVLHQKHANDLAKMLLDTIPPGSFPMENNTEAVARLHGLLPSVSKDMQRKIRKRFYGGPEDGS